MLGHDRLILVKSVHHGNTLRVARDIGCVLGADIADPDDMPHSRAMDYAMIGFGSGVYYGRMHRSLFEWIADCPDVRGSGRHAFVFSTSGLPVLSHFWHLPVTAMLRAKGFEVLKSYSCRGFDTWGPLWLAGGLNRTHPDAQDDARARAYAAGLVALTEHDT